MSKENSTQTGGPKIGRTFNDLVIEGKEFEWPHQFIIGKEVKNLGGLPANAKVCLSIKGPWEDEEVGDDDRIDLAREGIEEFFVRHELKFTLCGREYESKKQFISGAQLRSLGNIGPEDEILLLIQRPWDDELVNDQSRIDLARPGIEHFIVRKRGEHTLVTIEINKKTFKVKRGKHSVAELKKIGGVPVAEELEEKLNGKLEPLQDDADVLIKGCEQFFSHKRDGSSS